MKLYMVLNFESSTKDILNLQPKMFK